MMHGSFAVLALVAVAVIFGGLLAGLILLIVGLVKDRRGMWISGLVALSVSLALAVGLALTGFLAWFSHGVSSSAVVSGQYQVAATTLNADTMDADTRDLLGLGEDVPIPVGFWPLTSWRFRNGQGERRCAVLMVTDGFEALLKDHFQETTWADIQEQMTAKAVRISDSDDWDPARFKNLPCYRRTFTGPGGTRGEVSLCYDKINGKAHCLRREINQ